MGLGTELARKRAHVTLPADLLAEVDRLVGERGRGAFLTDLLRREIQRRNLLRALREAKGSWKAEEHPELKEGSEKFVERLRRENEARLKSLQDD
jgi:metal-responsive CopG/Arc/MetJ family transcriptional regulator